MDAGGDGALVPIVIETKPGVVAGGEQEPTAHSLCGLGYDQSSAIIAGMRLCTASICGGIGRVGEIPALCDRSFEMQGLGLTGVK